MPESDLARLEEGRYPPSLTEFSLVSESRDKSSDHVHRMQSQEVCYVAPQTKPISGTFAQAEAQSPSRLFFSDAGILLSNLRYLPHVLLPLTKYKNSKEDYLTKTKWKEIILQCALLFIETIIALTMPIACIVLPGLFCIVIIVVCWFIITLLLLPLQGSRILYSVKIEQDSATSPHHPNERWVFVNGIMTGNNGLQENIDTIAQNFGRPVVGIHNQTYGLPFDLIECLVQRCFSYNTLDVRVTYDYIKAYLYDPSIKRIVLIGHSQGGLVVSMALDSLYAEVPRALFRKLEIYTFGSAAKHFSNPPLDVDSTHVDLSVKTIEHYANEKDMVARWGPLCSVDHVSSSRYSGSVFVRKGGSGHLFIEHYLSVMFPLSSSISPTESPECPADEPNSFLDQIVESDREPATSTQPAPWTIPDVSSGRRRDSMFASIDESVTSDDALCNHDFRIQSSGEIGAGSASDAQRKTVRQLSRLWRYLGGACPDD